MIKAVMPSTNFFRQANANARNTDYLNSKPAASILIAGFYISQYSNNVVHYLIRYNLPHSCKQNITSMVCTKLLHTAIH